MKNRNLYTVITGPLITEKVTLVNETGNQVVFRVRSDADKHTIKEAVETLFKVQVLKVRTIQYLGKEKRVGRILGRKPGWKKAYITLAADNRIDFFEGV
jgi:large subunit ribosomal protein L23